MAPDKTHSGRGVVHPLVGAPSPLDNLPNPSLPSSQRYDVFRTLEPIIRFVRL
jgi:hypothetical protein